MTWVLIIWFAAVGDFPGPRGATVGPFNDLKTCTEVALAVEAAGRGLVHAGCAPS